MIIVALYLWVGPPPRYQKDPPDPTRREVPQAAAHQLGRKGRITREGIIAYAAIAAFRDS